MFKSKLKDITINVKDNSLSNTTARVRERGFTVSSLRILVSSSLDSLDFRIAYPRVVKTRDGSVIRTDVYMYDVCQFLPDISVEMAVNPLQIIPLIVLFVGFLAVPSLVKVLGTSLDSLPVRFAAVILVLGSVSYDRYVALGLFMFILAIYVQHHQNEVNRVLRQGSLFPVNDIDTPHAMTRLDMGGHADESYDTMDFIPKHGENDNEFSKALDSIDEKHALVGESHGKSHGLFADDLHHAEAMERGNMNGSHE